MTDASAELFFCSCLVAWAATHGIARARAREPVRLPDVAFWASALYFGVGPWVARFYASSFASVSPDVLVPTYAAIALHMAGLLCAARWLGSKRPDETIARAFRVRPGGVSVVVAAIGLLWAVRAWIAVRHGVLFSGTLHDQVGRFSPGLFALVQLSDIVGAGCLVWASGAVFRAGSSRRLALLFFAFEFGRAFLQGRSTVMNTGMFLMIGWLACHGRVRFRHTVTLGAFCAVLVLWVFPTFVALRVAHQGSRSRAELYGVVEALENHLTQTDDRIEELHRQNMSTRPLIVRFNADIAARQTAWGPMWGAALLSTVRWAVPSVLDPDKVGSLQAEDAVSFHHALPLVDRSGNWPAYGVADFGVIGGLVTGLLFGCVLMGMERFARGARTRFPFFVQCLIGAAILNAVAVETHVTATWVMLRNLALLFAVAVAAEVVRGIRRA